MGAGHSPDKDVSMNSSSPSSLRRRICLALPVALVTGSAALAARAQQPPPLSAVEAYRHPVLRRSRFDVTLKLGIGGETSESVVRMDDYQPIRISGVHGATPWSLELAIAPINRSENLRVESKLFSGAEVLAAPVRNAVVGQRVVLRADDEVYASLVIRLA
jgi:hypothetical protein